VTLSVLALVDRMDGLPVRREPFPVVDDVPSQLALFRHEPSALDRPRRLEIGAHSKPEGEQHDC